MARTTDNVLSRANWDFRPGHEKSRKLHVFNQYYACSNSYQTDWWRPHGADTPQYIYEIVHLYTLPVSVVMVK